MATGKSFSMENLGAEDLEQIAKMQSYRSVEQLEALSPSTGGHTIKDHETLIQELKKENFDLKLRLYMEQKERERVTEEFKQKILILEGDLTEALDELSDALEREKDFEACLENSKRREKALLNKQRRLEESCREQENEIQYLTLSRSRQNLDEIGGTAEASTMTDFPFYRERSVDVGFSDIPLNDTSASPTPTQTDARPQGVDLLNTSGTLLRKKNEIIREAKRRRTAKKKKREMAGSTYDVDVEMEKPEAKKKSFFSKLCCCVKQQSAEYEVDADQNRSRSRNYRR